MAAKQTKVQLVQGMDGQWRPRITAINGEIVLVGEGYRKPYDGARTLAKNLAALGHLLSGKSAGEIRGMIEMVPRE